MQDRIPLCSPELWQAGFRNGEGYGVWVRDACYTGLMCGTLFDPEAARKSLHYCLVNNSGTIASSHTPNGTARPLRGRKRGYPERGRHAGMVPACRCDRSCACGRARGGREGPAHIGERGGVGNDASGDRVRRTSSHLAACRRKSRGQLIPERHTAPPKPRGSLCS